MYDYEFKRLVDKAEDALCDRFPASDYEDIKCMARKVAAYCANTEAPIPYAINKLF